MVQLNGLSKILLVPKAPIRPPSRDLSTAKASIKPFAEASALATIRIVSKALTLLA